LLKSRLIPTRTVGEEAFKVYVVITMTSSGHVTVRLFLGTFL